MDQQLLICGFHRSGTSFVSQLLHTAGLHVGDDLLGSDSSNPYGHFEDRVPFAIHESILAANGLDWRVDRLRPMRIGRSHWQAMQEYIDERRADHRLWGFKDPRICLFMGAWSHLLPNAVRVVVFRDYRQCVASLQRRHGQNLVRGRGSESLNMAFFTDPDLALRMWVAHNESLVAAVRRDRDRCVVVPLSAVQRGAPLIGLLQRRFGVPLADVDVMDVFDPTVTRSTDPQIVVQDRDLQIRAERLQDALWTMSDLRERVGT